MGKPFHIADHQAAEGPSCEQQAGLDDGETDCDLGNAAEAYLLKCYR